MSRGDVNAHTHLYSGLAPFDMPGAAEGASFVEILEQVWWRLDRALDEQSLRAAAELYVAEALLYGTTVLIDHHESPNFIEGSLDLLADICQAQRMPALLCYGATERNGGREEAKRGLAECRRFIESNDRKLVKGAVGLHAGFTVSDEAIREAGELARELATVVHVHVAEGECDVADARERGYEGVIDRFMMLDGLPRGSILAHGVHLTEAEVQECRVMGLWLVQNPRSNTANGVGYPKALAQSDRVAIGTDGFPSDMRAEREALLASARDHGDDMMEVMPRLSTGSSMAEERLGDNRRAGHANGEVISEARSRAEGEARRLWQRMESL